MTAYARHYHNAEKAYFERGLITMKKEIKVIVAALVVLAVFLSGVVVGTINGGLVTIQMSGGSGSSTAVDATQAPATTAPTTAAPTTAAPTTAAPTTTAPTTAAPQGGDTTTTAAPQGGDTTTTAAPQGGSSAVPSTPAEACAAYCKAVNDAKAYSGNATVRRIEQIDVGVDSCSVAALKGTLDKVVRSFITSSDETFEMVNGAYQNDKGETRTMNDRLYPGGRNVTVAEANVTSATAVATPDGGYTVTLKLPSETSVFDNGTVTSSPTNHLTAVDPLDLATLNLDPVKIVKADMKYSGATVEATVNAEGKLVKLHINLPLEGTGSAKIGPAGLDLGVSGFMDTTFEITYK